MKIDPDRSRVVVSVRAEGMLARLAHDIRLEARDVEGERTADEIRARFPVGSLRVLESSRHGKDAYAPPKPDDARDIEHRVRTVALAGGDTVEVVGTREQVEVIAPRGAQRVRPDHLVVQDARVRGSCALSLSALGTGKIDVPLGAVRVADEVIVDFDIALV